MANETKLSSIINPEVLANMIEGKLVNAAAPVIPPYNRLDAVLEGFDLLGEYRIGSGRNADGQTGDMAFLLGHAIERIFRVVQHRFCKSADRQRRDRGIGGNGGIFLPVGSIGFALNKIETQKLPYRLLRFRR